MKYKEMIKALKGKMVLVPATFALAAGLALTGCGDADALEPNTQTSEIVSEIVSEETTEEISEVVSEETTEIASDVITEEEPTIVNEILTFEEAQAYIENLKTMYPTMPEEEIVALFVNFNIHSLDSDTIDHYSSKYNCVIHNIVNEKISAVMDTYFILNQGKKGTEYKDYWSLTDFVTNEQVKIMAQELEEHLNTMAYTPDDNEFAELNLKLENYQKGNYSEFTFDYYSEQKENTDLEGICYFVARYNLSYNTQGLGFDPETGYCPYQEYQNELGLSK